MAKDPAFLFYPGDWQGGTVTFSRHLKGCYIDLLVAQFNNGSLSLDEIKTVLGSDFGQTWPTLQKKFKVDSNGLFYNEKLLTESIKRKDFSKSRRKNLEGSTHMGSHMENENEKRRLEFIKKVDEFKNEFSEKILISFKSYWLEMNKSRTKFRFEGQTFFDFKKRLNTFLINDNQSKASDKQSTITTQAKDLTC